ncbi:MAG TPA: hypothetical protein VFJ52_02870 [Terriglobia bacterium]|nr:hypothetical protein [Terriglobia bacterium]
MVTPTPPVTVAISPGSASLLTGETTAFTATVAGSANKSVTWAVNGTAGGNSTVGTINATGLYTAPGIPPSPNKVTVGATSAADAGAGASAYVTIANPAPMLSAISPAHLAAGSADTALTLSGDGFAAQSVVQANGTALPTTVVSDTQLTAVVPSAMLTTAGMVSITVENPTPGGGASTAATLTISIAVLVSPATQTLDVNQSQQFSATVAGAADQGVTWAVDGVAGGNSTIGTITTAGLYAAPGIPPSPSSVTITAASSVDATQSAAATVTVVNPAPVLYSISPDAATAGDADTTLTVGGADFTAQSVVYSNSTALTTVYGNATQLTATVPSSLLASTGTFGITVVTPAPGGGTSTSLSFSVWAGYPRANAGSVFTAPPPALPQVPHNGTMVSVLDWTAKDNEGDSEDVLSADHMVTEMGIPNIDTTAFATAAANPFIVVAGVLNTASSLSAADISNLTSYVNGGGTLYLWEPNVSGLLAALGMGSTVNDYQMLADEQRPLTFDTAQSDPILKYVNAPEEINWAPFFPLDDVTRGYSSGSCIPLATWSTGDDAVLRCDIGNGRAYIFGWRLRPLLELPELQLGNDTGPQGVNAIVPDTDICRLLMRASYEAYATNPQERQWAPGGHHAALIITHDVDAAVSYQNVPASVDFENSMGFKSTYLFTTSPYDNGWISGMYNASGHQDILYALDHGFDIQSHSFGHFPDFQTALYSLTNPPSETAANYEPMFALITTSPFCCTSGMSAVGELGVSKWLLENDFNIPITAFRAGYTQIPSTFLQSLSATGYQRDLSYLNDLTRGAFPFVAFTLDSSVTPTAVTTYHVMEYPMSISGDASPAAGLTGLDTTTVSQYVDAWMKVIKFNYDNNAPTVLLLHPIDTTARFQAMQQLIAEIQNEGLDLWIGDLTTFAKFWEAQGVTNANWP